MGTRVRRGVRGINDYYSSMILHQNLGVILCGSSSGPVAVWSIDDNTLITSLEGHEGLFPLLCFFFSLCFLFFVLI